MSDFRKALQVGAARTGIENPLSSFGVDGQQMSSEPQMPKTMLRNPMSGEILMDNITSNGDNLFGVCRQGSVWKMTDDGWERVPMKAVGPQAVAPPEPILMLTPEEPEPVQDVPAPIPHPIEVLSTQFDVVVPIEMPTIQTPMVEVVEYDPSKDPSNQVVVEYDPSKDPDNSQVVQYDPSKDPDNQ